MSNVVRLPVEPDALEYSYVTGPDVVRVWALVGPHVVMALDDTLTEKEVYESIMERSAEMWIVHGRESGVPVATLVARPNQRGERRVLEVLTVGGSGFGEWSEVLQSILQRRMRELECEAMRAWCRRGMAKWLRALGWKERQVVMEWTNGR